MNRPAAPHIPVLLDEVLAAAAPGQGHTVVDATFGAGGYSRALLEQGASVHAFDRDPDAISEGQDLVREFAGRLTLHQAAFADMAGILSDLHGRVDAVVFDIGVSSMQLDRAERGFSFQADGPLNMLMEQNGETAADFVNTAEENDIADVLWRYGEERQSRRIARAIVAARPIDRTAALAQIVRKAIGHRPGTPKDPATRTFQALRIHVNGELQQLESGLVAAERLLKPGGAIVVVSFHSLEDRIVKRFLNDRSGKTARGSRHIPIAAAQTAPVTFEKLAKPVRATDGECRLNPRARSAILRSAIRTAVTSPGSERSAA